MAEKIKMDVDRLLLVLNYKKSFILAKYIGKLFLTIKTKSSFRPSNFHIIPDIELKILVIQSFKSISQLMCEFTKKSIGKFGIG